jgi:hypothetical protein
MQLTMFKLNQTAEVSLVSIAPFHAQTTVLRTFFYPYRYALHRLAAIETRHPDGVSLRSHTKRSWNATDPISKAMQARTVVEQRGKQ